MQERPRSAFVAGFAGTMGGCAALIFLPIAIVMLVAAPGLLFGVLALAFAIGVAWWAASNLLGYPKA